MPVCIIHLCKWAVGRGDVLMAEHGFTTALRCYKENLATVWVRVVESASSASVSAQVHCFFQNFSPVEHPSFNLGSTQHLEGVLKKSYYLSVQWRNLSKIWNNIHFHSEIFFIFSPPLLTQDTLVITRVRCYRSVDSPLWWQTLMANMGITELLLEKSQSSSPAVSSPSGIS